MTPAEARAALRALLTEALSPSYAGDAARRSSDGTVVGVVIPIGIAEPLTRPAPPAATSAAHLIAQLDDVDPADCTLPMIRHRDLLRLRLEANEHDEEAQAQAADLIDIAHLRGRLRRAIAAAEDRGDTERAAMLQRIRSDADDERPGWQFDAMEALDPPSGTPDPEAR